MRVFGLCEKPNYLDRTSKRRCQEEIQGIQPTTSLLRGDVADPETDSSWVTLARVCIAEQLCRVSAPRLCCPSTPRGAPQLHQTAGVCSHLIPQHSLLLNSPASAKQSAKDHGSPQAGFPPLVTQTRLHFLVSLVVPGTTMW